MSNKTQINTYDKITDSLYQVACLIDVVSKACYQDDMHSHGDTLAMALKLQYDIMDLISDIQPKVDIFKQT